MDNDASLNSRVDRNNRTPMTKVIWPFGILLLPVLLACSQGRAAAAEEDGVALAIVFDTSGSMKTSVRDAAGGQTPKYIIAGRALESIVQRIQHFATNAPGGPTRKIQAGLFSFSGKEAVESVRFGPFEPTVFQAWAKNSSRPTNATPLGKALRLAGRALLDSKLSQKHVLVITDGLNTIDPDPVEVVPKITKEAIARNERVFIHFVAFDVDAKVFAPLKKLGVTVVGATDEKQLNQQLEFILAKKILLEDEEPKK